MCACVVSSGCSFDFAFGDSVRGSGVVTTEERSVGEFHGVNLQGSADVVHEIGPLRVTVEADDNIVPLIKTEVVDGVLIVSSEGSYSTREGVVVRASSPRLDMISLTGSGDVEAATMTGEALTVSLRGSGDVRVKNVRTPRLDVELEGSGDVSAKGAAERVKVVLLGSGDVDLDDVDARAARIELKGSGDVSVHATEALEAIVRGSGDVTYRGNPETVSRDVQGSGEVVAR
jgi:hypothetical protein